MIKISQLTKGYTLKNKNQITAIKNINLELKDKGLVFLLGKSGSGKSTLLNIIGGLDRATSGSILVDGNQLSFLKENDLCNYRNTRIGFVFQDYQLVNELTVYQNVALALEIKGCFSNALVLQAIKKVGLNGYEERYPTELSGGEKQRVAIARAIVKDPCVVLADEPTGNLDDDTATAIMELLKDLSKERLVFVASHNKTFASVYGDRTIELSQGKIILDSQVQKSDTQNSNNKNIIDKPKFALSKQLKLSGRFLKRRVSSIALSAFMAAVIMIVLSFA